ncbi:Fur-regulated basic protein FbpA [Sporolactobacillus vineae]|uniref:Fur-regulated basic protein FbpA n=1 Tax=Sporolactobacillus vineae TaxID=444463 RepID=UPI000289E020|nr:Fur-regulated basic protein FbpA [Sporolactobacillus vineae]
MSGILTVPRADKKEQMIEKLLAGGIYKAGNHQLYELSLQELENTYHRLLNKN